MKKALLLSSFVINALIVNAQINLTATRFVSENFNSMSGGNLLNLPTGWKMSAAGINADWTTPGNFTTVTQSANGGSPTTAGRYNWGTVAGTDRAIGFMTDGGYPSPNTILADIHNQTGETITQLTISFQIERYRINASGFSLTFYLSSTGSSWNSQAAGDMSNAVFTPGTSSYTFSTPQTVYKTVIISGISIANNTDYYLKWVFTSAGTSGQGMGLDNFTINADTDTPVVTATLSDGVSAAVKQGDPLTYSATVYNKGKDATGVQYNATLDPNTTLNGSAKSSALGRGDSYSTSFNTQLTGQNVLTNDFGLPSLTVVSFGSTETPSATSSGNTGESDNGGVVVVNSDGTFTYTPPTGFVGYDRFAYTAHAGISPDDVAIVTIAVGSQPSAGTAESFPGVIGNVPVNNAPSLLSNDGGDVVKIAGINGNAVNSFPFSTSTSHGSLTVNGTGTFVYNPAAGYEGTDNFTYTIDNGFSSAQTVTVNITVSGMIWFIDNTAGSGGDGRLLSPFNSLTNFQLANNGSGSNPASGDCIFIYTGSGNYIQNVSLLSNQKLIGAGASQSLSVITGYTVPSYSAALPSTGLAAPVIAAATNAVITLAGGTTVRGVAISGGSNSISGSNVANITVKENSFTGASSDAVSITALSGTSSITNNTVSSAGIGVKLTTTTAAGALSLNFSNNSMNSGTTGASLDGSAGGPLNITGFADNSVSGSITGTGITINTAKFDLTPGGVYSMIYAGNLNIGASGNGVGGNGLILTNVSGLLYFDLLNIYADGGSGLAVTGSGTAIPDAGTGFGIMIYPNASTVEAVGGPAINISNASISLQMLSVKSTNSSTTGISLVNTSQISGGDIFSVTSGFLSNATGSDLNIDGGSGNITIPIPITSSAGNAISISNHAGSTMTISGAVTTSAGGGISLSGNSSSAIGFSGGITLNGSSSVFSATGGGTLTITGSNNTIGSTSAPSTTALTITNTTIGASGVTFKSISENGGVNGIVVNNTGSSGSLTITGDGTANSAGTIQHTTSHGIMLTSTLSPSFDRMHIYITAGSGIKGTTVNNFSFTNGLIEYSGFTSTSTPVDATAIDNINIGNITFNNGSSGTPLSTEKNLTGAVTITNNTLNYGLYNGIDIYNYDGTISNLNVSHNSFTSGTTTGSSGTSYGSAIRVIMYGGATTSSSVTKGSFDHNTIIGFPGGGGIQLQGGNQTNGGPGGSFGIAGDATNVVNVTNNTIHGFSSDIKMNTNAILFTIGGANSSSRSQGNVYIANNGTIADPLANMTGTGISPNAFGFATVTAVIDNNVMAPNNGLGSQGIAGGITYQVTTADNPIMKLEVTNNTISQTDGNGILLIERSVTGSFDLLVRNNSVAAPLSGVRQGIRIDCGNTTGNGTMCLNISNNTSAGSGGATGIGLRKQGTVATTNTFGIAGLSPSPATAAETVTFVTGNNPSGGGVFIISGDNFVSCNTAPSLVKRDIQSKPSTLQR